MATGITSNEMDESYRQHKNYFQHFLDVDDATSGNYVEKIRHMMNEQKGRLIVSMDDLRSYNNKFPEYNGNEDNIVERLIRNPTDYIPPFEEAINELVMNYDNKAAKVHHRFAVGFEGSLGATEVSPRGLLAELLNKMVCVTGIVTKCSIVRPKVVRSVHYCPATNQISAREYRDGTSIHGVPTATVYPTKDDKGNLLETEFGLCVYKDYQLMTIQEAPETAPLGQLPRSVDIVLENDLVDKCKPGDRLKAFGCYRALTGKQSAQSNTVFKTMLIANNVQVLGKEIQGIVMTTTDLWNVRNLAKRDDIFEILGRSVAPSIYGHNIIKQALLLQLLSGVEKNLDNGTHLRGDINILMVGDPSTAKSQLLRFVRNIAPLAVNTTGRGSSGVGLTAAVTRDRETHERRLEAGAMVLADRGIVCIDEFDKMSEADRVAIHEVMEQQTVTIAKAGIHATLNARCSVLAAANPVYGQYNKNRRPQENIGLPDSLLSRFDLLFVVLDKLDRRVDRHIAEHVIRMHRYVRHGLEGVPLSLSSSNTILEEVELDAETGEEKETTSMWQKYNPVLHGKRCSSSSAEDRDGYEDVLSTQFLKKYIYYAKNRFNPTLTDVAIDTISQGYSELRSEQNEKTLPVTARSLETLIRLSSAHAKARMSQSIDEKDAEKALELMKFALYHDTTTHTKETQKTTKAAVETAQEPEPVPSGSSPTTSTSRKRNRSPQDPTTSAAVIRVLNLYLAGQPEGTLGMPLAVMLDHLHQEGYTLNMEQLQTVLTEMEIQNHLLYNRTDEIVVSLIDT